MDQLKAITEAPLNAGIGRYEALMQPWVLMIALASVGLMLGAWLWRRRKAQFASKRSLYGSWQATIPRYRRSLPRLTAELERARRYHHTLTITVLAVDVEQHRQKNSSLINLMGNSEIASQFFFSLIGSILRDNVRGSDMVTYDVTNDFYVLLLPEAGLQTTEQTLFRLRKLVMQRSKVVLRFGVAEYPAEGLILQDLVNIALAKSQRTASETPPQNAAHSNGQLEQRKDALAEHVK